MCKWLRSNGIVGRDGTINDRGTGYMVRNDRDSQRLPEDSQFHEDDSHGHPSALKNSQQSIQKIEEEKYENINNI